MTGFAGAIAVVRKALSERQAAQALACIQQGTAYPQLGAQILCLSTWLSC
ncbi:hypothetical protein [Pseudomonas sp. SJZ079]|nr:hypothetical protein [Pseudomonas sp. SJZ079]